MNPFRQAAAISVLFIVVGVVCLIACGITFSHTRAFLATAKTTSGRVIGLDPDTDSHHNITYHTVFTFTDDSNNAHTIRTSYAQRPQPYSVGDRIVILYPPDSPESARIRSFSSLWLAPVILVTVGLLFPVMGLLAFISARKTYGTA
jgi:hypothetical protein